MTVLVNYDITSMGMGVIVNSCITETDRIYEGEHVMIKECINRNRLRISECLS